MGKYGIISFVVIALSFLTGLYVKGQAGADVNISVRDYELYDEKAFINYEIKSDKSWDKILIHRNEQEEVIMEKPVITGSGIAATDSSMTVTGSTEVVTGSIETVTGSSETVTGSAVVVTGSAVVGFPDGRLGKVETWIEVICGRDSMESNHINLEYDRRDPMISWEESGESKMTYQRGFYRARSLIFHKARGYFSLFDVLQDSLGIEGKYEWKQIDDNTVKLSFSGEGEHRIYMKQSLMDLQGKWIDWNEVHNLCGSFILDTLSPTIEAWKDRNQKIYKTENKKEYINEGRKFQICIKDDNLSLENTNLVCIMENEEKVSPLILQKESIGQGILVKGMLPKDGKYQKILVQAKDMAGNTVLEEIEMDVVVDTVLPNGKLTISVDGEKIKSQEEAIIKGELLMKLEGSDSGSGVEDLSYRFGEVLQWKKYQNPVLFEGEFQGNIMGRVVDQCGNYVVLNSQNLIVDGTSPKVELNMDVEKIWKEDIPVEVVAQETGKVNSGVSVVQYKVYYDGVVKQEDKFKGGEGNYHFRIHCSKERGTKGTLVIESMDKAGNMSTIKREFHFDHEEPQLEVVGVPKQTYCNQKGNVYFRVWDDYFSQKDTQVMLNGNPVTVIFHKTREGFMEGMYPYDVDGKYEFSLTSIDMAGNKSKRVNGDSFELDTQKPIVELNWVNEKPSLYNKERGRAVLTIRDENLKDPINKGLQIKGKNVNISVNQSKKQATIELEWGEGKHSFLYQVTDQAGNSSEAIQVSDFIIDETKPKVHLGNIFSEPEVVVEDKYLESWNCSMNLSFEGYKESQDKFIALQGKVAKGRISYSLDEQGLSLEKDGRYVLNWELRDMAGNINQGKQIFIRNEDGSLFSLGKASVWNKKYLTKISLPITIHEYNPHPIQETSDRLKIYRDGKQLKAISGMSVTYNGRKEGYHSYTYEIDKDVFQKEGAYHIGIRGKDAVNHDVASDKKTELEFVIDKHSPSCSFQNIETKGRYQGKEKEVRVRMVDNYGIRDAVVWLDGKIANTNHREDSLVFLLGAGKHREILLEATDYAGNISRVQCEDIFVGEEQKQEEKTKDSLWIYIVLAVAVFNVTFVIIYRKYNKAS